MEIQGRVVAILPEQRITGKNGEIVKNFFVIETNEQYANKIKFEVFGDERWGKMEIKEGQTLSVSFDIKGAEWKGNYFVNLNAWKVTHIGDTKQEQPKQQDTAKRESKPIAPKEEPQQQEGSDDIPF